MLAAMQESSAVASCARDERLRLLYATAAMASIPRLLGAIDRNPFRATYGCLDRQFWHYRTSSFPSEMYQEGVLPLALVHAYALPDNGWHGDGTVRELALAALRFSVRSCHADGSCDDYYPHERALGAAVFSLQAAAQACQVLGVDDREILRWLERRAHWVIDHDESGRLTNHHALAALGLVRLAELTGRREYQQAAAERVQRVLAWQSDEGWFDEYGGADPGYQTVTIDCLAKYQRIVADPQLDEPLERAVTFAARFLHPDHSYGGEYGSRGTYHFYPHGFELLAARLIPAADLADGFLQSLACGTQAHFDDDRMYVHRLGNLIEAWLNWAPQRPAIDPAATTDKTEYLINAGLLVRRTATTHTVISAARGGVFKHFAAGHSSATDAGLIVETLDGRVAVSQVHDRNAPATHLPGGPMIVRQLDWVRFEIVTPWKQACFHLGMWSVGRWCRTLVRRTLQRRLITGRRPCPIRLTRTFEFIRTEREARLVSLRVTDRIQLADRRIQVARMSFATDLQSAYVAASGAYQRSALQPWLDLASHVDELNRTRETTVIREFP